MLPSFTELEYFLEIANTLNLSRASERIGISQPSLSMAIKRLEHTVGTELLIRHAHGVALTQSGKQFLRQIKKLMAQWQDARACALASVHEIQGSFTLGCHASLAVDWCWQFVPNLLEQYRKLEIHIRNDASRRIVEKIINFKIDLGIVINPVRHPDLIIRPIGLDEMAFWTIKQPRVIHDMMSGHSVILCETDLLQSNALIQKGRAIGFDIDRIIGVDSLEVIAKLTANGAGIGILPISVASKYPQLMQVPNSPIFQEEVCLVYRPEQRNIPAIKVIVESIINIIDGQDKLNLMGKILETR